MSVSRSVPSTAPRTEVDVRGPRFSAWVTTGVLILTVLLSGISSLAAAVLLGAQAVIFAIGAYGGPRKHPYGRLFATLITPRLGPVTEREPAAPLKFAALVGFVFALLGALGFAFDATTLGLIATASALVAAFLNAAFGICLGCQIYPLVVRFRHTPTAV